MGLGVMLLLSIVAGGLYKLFRWHGQAGCLTERQARSGWWMEEVRVKGGSKYARVYHQRPRH